MKIITTKSTVTLLLLAAILITGCKEDKPPVNSKRPGNNKKSSAKKMPTQTWQPTLLADIPARDPGKHQQLVKHADGNQTSYTMIVPENYDAKKPAPLIVVLHFGGNGLFYSRGILEGLVSPALESLNAIMIAPDVIPNRMGWGSEENEKAVLALMDAVIEKYNIDPDRILLTGFSMGGHGTFHLAAKFPERFTAAIPVAGFPRRIATDKKWPLPMMVLHSVDDKRVVIEPTRDFVEKIKKNGAPVEMMELEGLKHGPVSDYVDALRGTIAWLEETWDKKAAE